MPPNLNQRITLVFQSSDHNTPHVTYRELLTPVPINASILCYFSSYFSSMLSSCGYLPPTHGDIFHLTAPSSQLSAYRSIISWIASNEPPRLIHPFPDLDRSYPSTALLHQAASTLGISILHRQFLHRLETLVPRDSDIHRLLSEVPATDISITLIVNDLARQFCEAYRTHNCKNPNKIEALLDRQPSRTFRNLVRREIERRCTHPCACRADYCCGGPGCCVHRFSSGRFHDEGAGAGAGTGMGHAANHLHRPCGNGRGLRRTSYHSESHHIREHTHTRESLTSYSPASVTLRKLSDFESYHHDHPSHACALDSGYSSTCPSRSASLDSSTLSVDDEEYFTYPIAPSSTSPSTTIVPLPTSSHPSRRSKYTHSYSPFNLLACPKHNPQPPHAPHSYHAHTPNAHKHVSLPSPRPPHPCTHLHPHEIEVTKHHDISGKPHLTATRARRASPSPSASQSTHTDNCHCHHEYPTSSTTRPFSHPNKSKDSPRKKQDTPSPHHHQHAHVHVNSNSSSSSSSTEEYYKKRTKTRIRTSVYLDRPGPVGCVTM